ncbi:CapA family protein [Streptomyces sp. NPDC048604]|uniref:CapA family protein n=1 Tax=Streptomyces sp. NPDC048604 TaxID=3365578 RepID=UPI00371A88C7
MGRAQVRLFLCGDVMLGRGVDQILPHPVDPALAEPYVRDARDYVALAEAVNGPVPRPVDPSYPWGETLGVLERAAPDARIVNLETAVTEDGERAPGKPLHYRMHPANLPALTVARPDVCVLANNHVLDLGPAGLHDTLATLAAAGLRTAGAGRDDEEARRPAVVPLPHGGRVVVYALGLASSGVPPDWAAGPDRAGVHYAAGPADRTAVRLAARIRADKVPGDVVVVSVHGGSNWGYGVPRDLAVLARRLVDAGADVVHGHSSHHPRPLEAYRGRLVLHGCGDLINDYEGISGYEQYRDDLRLLPVVAVGADDGAFLEARLTPFRSRRLRLEHASAGDGQWLHEVLDRISRPFGVRVELAPDGTPTARPA